MEGKLSTERQGINVAYGGRTESFTYLAAKSVFREKAFLTGCATMKAVFEQVQTGAADYGVLALESSSHGSIHSVYDALLNQEGAITIVAELGQSEEHCFCTDKSAAVFQISEVHGHPVVLECCSSFLSDIDAKRASRGLPDLKKIPSADSVDAVIAARAASNGNIQAAAIASKEAAFVNGMFAAVKGIGNDGNAETRYVVIARANSSAGAVHDPLHIAPEPPKWVDARPRGVLKASIALGLRNIPGALFKMTSCFAFRDMNIVKIESRPSSVASPLSSTSLLASSRRHWDLIYYVDYEPSDSPAVNQALLVSLREYCLWVRELGFYFGGLHPAEATPAEWKNMLEVVGH